MASTTFLQKAYLAYFGRPADASGLLTFANVSEDQVIASFSASAESQEFFGSMPLLDQINTIYNNLFNRDAEPAGLLHWAGKIERGELSLAAAAMEILNNAQNSDVTAVANKVAASAAFTAAVDTTAEILGYAGAASIAPARAYLAAVTSDAATLTAALDGTDAAVTAVVAAGTGAVNAGQTFMLTANADTFGGTEKNDTITGNSLSYTAGDEINGGNGTDTLSLVLNEDNTAYAGQIVSNVENIVVRAIASSGDAVTLNMSDVSGVNNVTVRKSTGNMVLQDLQQGVDVVLDDVAGHVTIDYDTQNAPAEQNVSMNEFGASANEYDAKTLTVDERVETLNIADASTGEGFYNSAVVMGGFSELNVTGGAAGTDLYMRIDSSASTLDADLSTNGSDGKVIIVVQSQDLTLKTGQFDDVVEIIGNLTADSTVDTGAGSDELLTNDILGEVLLGEGDNTLASGVVAGSVTAGSGDDELATGAILGDIVLGEGNNTLSSNDISGTVTAGAGDNVIDVVGDISGQIEATDGDNFISAALIGVPDGIAPAEPDPIVDTTSITLGDGNNIVVASDEITGQAALSFGNGQNIVLAGFTAAEDLIFSDIEENGVDISGNASLTFGDGDNLVVVQNDIEDDASLSFGLGDNTVLVGDEIQNNASITFAGGNNTVRVLQFYGEDSVEVGQEVVSVEDAQAAIIDGLTTMEGDWGDGNLNDNANIAFGGEGNNTLEVSGYLGSEDVIELVDDVEVVIAATTTTVTFGNGDNTADVGYDVINGDITFGDGANTMTVGDDVIDSEVSFGEGNNTLSIDDSLETSNITFGDGVNTLTVGDDVDTAVVSFGDGGNTMTVEDNVRNGAAISFGSGEDNLSVGSVNNGADIYSDTGTITTIDMGAGNDTLSLYSEDSGDGTVTSGATVDGGEGANDVLQFDAADNNVNLIARNEYQQFAFTLDQDYAIGDVVSIVVGGTTISYTVLASDFPQGDVTQELVRINIAESLAEAANELLGENGTETFSADYEENVVTFGAWNYGPDAVVTTTSGTLEHLQFSDASITGFETLNLNSVAGAEGDFGDLNVDFSMVDGVTKAINMDNTSTVTATADLPANSGFDQGYAASFYLYNLDTVESRLLSIAADELTAEGDHQAVQITIGNQNEDHAIGDVITVSIGDTDVSYEVTAADLAGEDSQVDAENIAANLKLAIAAAATSAGFSIATSTDNTITLVGSTHEDVAFGISTTPAGNGPQTPNVDTITPLVGASADDDSDADVSVNAYIADEADTDNDTLTLVVNGRGNFDLDLSTQNYGGEDFEHIEIDVKDTFSHFIDFVDFDTENYFQQDGSLTLTGGTAGESIYLDNVVKATVDARTSAADLTIRMVGSFDASLEVRTGSGDDTLLMQDSGNEFALINLDDTINLGGGYNTLVMNAQNIDNQNNLVDLEGYDEWYGDGYSDYEYGEGGNAYAYAYADFDNDDDYIRGENVIVDADFTTTRNVQKLVLGTDRQAEDQFKDSSAGTFDRNSSSFDVELDEQAKAAGIKDVVFSDNQTGSTVLTINNQYWSNQNSWNVGDDIHLVIGDIEVNYTVDAADLEGSQLLFGANIAASLFEAIEIEFNVEGVEGAIDLSELGITVELDGSNLYFGNADDGMVFAEAYTDGDFQPVSLNARNLEDSVIGFGSAYGEGDELTVTTYAALDDSDTDRLDVVNDTYGANLTVNVRDLDIRDRDTSQGFLGNFLTVYYGEADPEEMDNYQNVLVRDPRDQEGNESDYYTDFVSRVMVFGSTDSVDTINVVTTGVDGVLRINGTSIDAVNVSSTQGSYNSEFVLDVDNNYAELEGSPETLTFDASALTDAEGGITVHLATVYEGFNYSNESYIDADYMYGVLGEGFNGNTGFGPISADAYIVSATNQAEVLLDLTATAGADFISGGKYGDEIRGGAGDDILLGNGGADTLHAGDDAESSNILQGDLVTAENQVVEVSFANNYDEDDVISVTVNGNTYSYEVTANGGEAEAEGDGFNSEGALTNDFDDANGALVVNALRDLINLDFEGNNQGELTAALAMDDDEWVFDFSVDGGVVAVEVTIDGRQITASGSTALELAQNFVDRINAASYADTAQDYLIAQAYLNGDNVIIKRAVAVSDMYQYGGTGSFTNRDVTRYDNGTNLYVVGVIAGDDLQVSADIVNNDIADYPQVYTISSSVNVDYQSEASDEDRYFYVVIDGQTYIYDPASGDTLDDIADALGASDISYSNDVITILGPTSGADMPLITQAYVRDDGSEEIFSAYIDITDARQPGSEQDVPAVTVVQDYHTTYADEQDTLIGGTGIDTFFINKSADSTTIADAIEAMDTIENLQLGEEGDFVGLNAFVMNAESFLTIQSLQSDFGPYGELLPLSLIGGAGGAYTSYFADWTGILEISNVVNFGAAAAMNVNAADLATAVNGLFAENNVFEVSGSAATNSAGLFTYEGETYLIAVGDDATASFGADDYIVKLVGVTGHLSVDNFVDHTLIG